MPANAEEDAHVFEVPPAEQCGRFLVTMHPARSHQLRLQQNRSTDLARLLFAFHFQAPNGIVDSCFGCCARYYS
jgi:hypothetical protein